VHSLLGPGHRWHLPGKIAFKVDSIVFQEVLGIKFLVGGYAQAKDLLNQGALMVAPAGPAITMIKKDTQYYSALKESDFAIPDSGLMVLVLRLFKHIKLTKLSGLRFLRSFFSEAELRKSRCLFIIDPNDYERSLNHCYLLAKGVSIDESDHYVAPSYRQTDVADYRLLQILNERRPRYIIINLGGGVQEKLGLFLRKHLNYRPGIICTGAAIAFLTQRQANIPPLIDKFHMGWFLRCLHDPKRFIRRSLEGLFLIPLILKEVK
jgi:N-acetylglucosaminyldiphosphoundecaprenol N-acetyl-beta-D-mannosaminyltransferase